MPPASIAHVLGRSNKEEQRKLGQWTGMMYSVAAIFALTGPVIAGHLVSHYHRYITVQLWSGSCLFLGAVCMLMARLQAGPSRTLNQMRRLTSAASSVVMREKDIEEAGVQTPRIGGQTPRIEEARTPRTGAQTPQRGTQTLQLREQV